MPHTYTFIPDIGENLVALGEHAAALGRVWHLPSPETRSTRDVVALVYQAAGTTPSRLSPESPSPPVQRHRRVTRRSSCAEAIASQT
jgi:nucleoside-diphosphate-sugar epimerase